MGLDHITPSCMTPRVPIKRTWDLPKLQLRQLPVGLSCALRLREEYFPESGWFSASHTHDYIRYYICCKYTTRKNGIAWVVYVVRC